MAIAIATFLFSLTYKINLQQYLLLLQMPHVLLKYSKTKKEEEGHKKKGGRRVSVGGDKMGKRNGEKKGEIK